jgi:hypothetical protein
MEAYIPPQEVVRTVVIDDELTVKVLFRIWNDGSIGAKVID